MMVSVLVSAYYDVLNNRSLTIFSLTYFFLFLIFGSFLIIYIYIYIYIVFYYYYYYNIAGKPAIGGPWSLIDLEGELVTNVSFQGKWLLLYFGFARCPDICPSEMLKIARVIDGLKETHPQLASKLVPVFVSVDPARDSLTALKECKFCCCC